ncbi:MAG: ABC transporter ATP-binding protein [Clostridia bacterium]|nr:ABC transporter ATP-binding protein [Clostridia bacterium]
MAKRSLADLQARYSRSDKGQKRPMMGGPRGGPAMRMHGKPKDMKKTIGRIWSYVSVYKYRLFTVLFCMLFSTVSSLIGAYLLSPIINRITLALKPDADISLSAIGRVADRVIGRVAETAIFEKIASYGKFPTVMAYVFAGVVIMFSFYLVSVVTTYVQSRIMLSVSQGASERIRNDLFHRVSMLPVRYYDKNPVGEVMSRFTNDVDNIDMMLNNTLTSLVSGVITLLGTFFFMVTTNIWLTLVTVVFIPIFMLGGARIAKFSARHYKSQQAALGAVNGYIEETVKGQRVVKVFNHEDTCVEEFELLNNDMRDKQLKAQFFGGIMGPIMGNTSQISYAVTIGIGGILMCTTGLGPGDLTVFANYSRQFSMPINMISQNMSTVFAALAGAERVFAVMDEEPEPADRADARDGKNIRGDVVLENVSFGYLPGQTVLKNISLYAHPGQKIAFVGSTGAGKTTITNLLNRFYDIRSGRITIDGVDIKDYQLKELRRNIAMVLQETNLFTGTVRENIRYGRLDATDEEIVAAARTASAHSFIMRLEHGYDTMIEGNGANLSQGQRQLLNIARAALSRAPILVLDEATSSVDTRTERLIERGMDALMEDRTTFVIAHRLSTVRNSDAIMVLEKGEIIERGDHDTLLAMKGRYYELYTGKKELE